MVNSHHMLTMTPLQWERLAAICKGFGLDPAIHADVNDVILYKLGLLKRVPGAK